MQLSLKMLPINTQEKAFFKTKYSVAIAEKIGLKPDTIRRSKKLKTTHKVLTDIGQNLHLVKK